MTSGAHEISFQSRDGRILRGTIVRPERVRGAVVIAPAMGVPQRFYGRLADRLVREDRLVVTFDYRGIGASLEGRVEDERASLVTWGLDAQAALDVTLRELEALRGAWAVPRPPTAWLGHSVGGQLFGLLEAPRVDQLLLVASQSGWSGHWSGLGRVGMATLWRVLPIAVRLTGKLPKQLLGGGEHVPPLVGREWARFGRHPDYILSYARGVPSAAFHTFEGRVDAWAFTDDAYAPERAVRALAAAFAKARPTLHVTRPADLGQRRVGHFGAFRPPVLEPFASALVQSLLG